MQNSSCGKDVAARRRERLTYKFDGKLRDINECWAVFDKQIFSFWYEMNISDTRLIIVIVKKRLRFVK